MRLRRSDRPVWLLDIDGVVNALSSHALTEPWPAAEWRQLVVRTEVRGRGAMTLPILVAQPVVDFIARVHAERRAEIRWHSTWREAAVTSLSPALKLPRIPISHAPEWAEQPPQWWKLPAAQRVLDSGRRLLWTDDQFPLYREDPRSADELALVEASGRALLLASEPDTGLSPDDLTRIEAFLDRPTAAHRRPRGRGADP